MEPEGGSVSRGRSQRKGEGGRRIPAYKNARLRSETEPGTG